jgi:hypothetical protein
MKSINLAIFLTLIGAGAARAEPDINPYPAAYAASMKDRLPVLVFVGQPAREFPGTRSIAVRSFPDAVAPCVVVGVVRDREMVRKDFGGAPTTPGIQATIASLSNSRSAEALNEVNEARAARGLGPYIRDDNLTSAATACAEFRADRLMAGHTSNDFAVLPPGSSAASAGCAAWEPDFGWGSCCTYDGYTYAGAAYATGRDGRRYMHLFVR